MDAPASLHVKELGFTLLSGGTSPKAEAEQANP